MLHLPADANHQALLRSRKERLSDALMKSRSNVGNMLGVPTLVVTFGCSLLTTSAWEVRSCIASTNNAMQMPQKKMEIMQKGLAGTINPDVAD